jgi:hypothetical protein
MPEDFSCDVLGYNPEIINSLTDEQVDAFFKAFRDREVLD